MLQRGNVLATYRLELPPEQIMQKSCKAVKITDHPIKFLAYEGKVNKGMGSVEIVDSGLYKILNESDARLELNFEGNIINGKFAITRIEGDNWQFAVADKI